MVLLNSQKSILCTLLLSLTLSAACGSQEGVGSGSFGSDSLGSVGGTGVTNTVASPAEMSVGDIMPMQLGQGSQTIIDFSGVDDNAEFIFIAGSAQPGGSGSTVQLAADVSALADLSAKSYAAHSYSEEALDEEEAAYGAEDIFDAWLRAAETDLALNHEEMGGSSLSASKSLQVSKAASLGDVETFRVLGSLTSVSSYQEIDAELKCIGDLVEVYVDVRVSNSDLPAVKLNQLCDMYEAAAEEELEILDAHDVLEDKVAVLINYGINNLSELAGGIITGYFWAGDLYPCNSGNVVCNYREIVHTLAPDNSGAYGPTISTNFYMSNLAPAVFPHEFQHLISYKEHVFEAGGSAEVSWLNEAISHFMEDRLGHGNENPSRYELFLANPASAGLVTSSSPGLTERGAGFLFMRFLYEQAENSEAFLQALLHTDMVGVDNIEEAFNGPEDFDQFSEFFGRWTVALALTDRGVTSDSRYVYQSRTFNETTEKWQGVCLICDADDNRSTQLDGITLSQFNDYGSAFVDSSAAKYYYLDDVPGSLVLQSTGNSDFGMLIRVQ